MSATRMSILRNKTTPLAPVFSLIICLSAGCSDGSDDGGEDTISVQDAGSEADTGTVTDPDVPVKLDGMICAPGIAKGCKSNVEIVRCATDGSGYIVETCFDAEDNITSCIQPNAGDPSSAFCTECGQGQKRCDPDPARLFAIDLFFQEDTIPRVD